MAIESSEPVHATADSDRAAIARESRMLRGRFTLWQLFAAMTVLALVLALVVTTRRMRDAERELLSLRNDMGQLNISNPRQLHAIEIPQKFDGLTYRWRVYWPSGRKFRVLMATGNVPGTGDPLPNREQTHLAWFDVPAAAETRETIVSIALRRDHSGKWVWSRDLGMGGSSEMPIDTTTAQWLDSLGSANSSTTTVHAGAGHTEMLAPGKPLVLFNLRKAKAVAGGFTVDDRPTDGVLVWIEEKE